MGMEGLIKYVTCCTVKTTYTVREEAGDNCIKIINAFYKQLQKIGDKKVFLALWFDSNDNKTENITTRSKFLLKVSEMSGYIPRFFVRRGIGKKTEYYHLNIGHIESIKNIK